MEVERNYLSAQVTEQDWADAVKDRYGVMYSSDGMRLLKCVNNNLTEYTVRDGTSVICDVAFLGCDSLARVAIGNSVTKIGQEAFYNCARLATINIPDSVNTIGERAFYGCTGLTKFEVLENNEYYCTVDGVLFTKDMTTLVQFPAASSTTSYRIPESVTTIRSYAFYNCSGLIEVTIGEGVTKIGESAFDTCTGLTTVNFNAIACTTTGPYSCAAVFGGCSNISKVNIGYNVTIIPEGLCSGLKGLTQATIPDGVKKIGDGAFASCSGLKNVTIPRSVTTIGGSAFFFCESLECIDVPDFVISIGDFSFMSCRNLLNVTLGSSLKYVGIKSFVDCPALGIIISRNSEPPICSGYISFDASWCTLYVPKGSKAAYSNSIGWNKFFCIREYE